MDGQNLILPTSLQNLHYHSYHFNTIVEILFPKQPLRARALEIISVHKIEVSEGVSIFIKGRKIKIPLPYRIKDGQISLKFHFLREGP